MASTLMSTLKTYALRAEEQVLCALRLGFIQKGWWPPGVALAGVDVPTLPNDTPSSGSALSSLHQHILWAVPKRRVSLERRMMRRMGPSRMMKWATPKKNIIECLECGHWHEAHTICGSCYDKVRAETAEMASQIPENAQCFDVPRSEMVYLYKGEELEKNSQQGRCIVEMEKPRPEWWPKNLLTKGGR